MSEKPEWYGLRRRCGWCGVVLRLWQINLCRRCYLTALDNHSPSPWTAHGSRWEDYPDDWKWPWQTL